jgi:SAM-dependent methyltransferase
MDTESHQIMHAAIQEHGFGGGTVLDFGAYDVNGTYRGLMQGKYIGVDIIPGPNVDVLLDSPEFRQIQGVDAVISGQTIEHVADIPGFMAAIIGTLKPGGYFVIIAPSEGPGHNYPIWVGNFPEERLREAVVAGGFDIVSVTTSSVLPWKLCCCVARKPELMKRYRKANSEARKDDDENQ